MFVPEGGKKVGGMSALSAAKFALAVARGCQEKDIVNFGIPRVSSLETVQKYRQKIVCALAPPKESSSNACDQMPNGAGLSVEDPAITCEPTVAEQSGLALQRSAGSDGNAQALERLK